MVSLVLDMASYILLMTTMMTLVLDMASKHPVIDHNDDFSLGLYKMAEFSNFFCNLCDNEKKNKIAEYFCDVENE